MKVVHCIAGSTIKKHFHYIILMWLFCLTITTILWRDYHLLTSMVFNQHWTICHQKRLGPTETRPLYLTHSDRMWVAICLSNPRHDNSNNLSPKLLSPGSTKTPMTRPHFWCRVSPPRFAQTQLQLFTTRQTELQRSKFIIHNLQNSPTAQAASL
jgi:hypothetical protein